MAVAHQVVSGWSIASVPSASVVTPADAAWVLPPYVGDGTAPVGSSLYPAMDDDGPTYGSFTESLREGLVDRLRAAEREAASSRYLRHYSCCLPLTACRSPLPTTLYLQSTTDWGLCHCKLDYAFLSQPSPLRCRNYVDALLLTTYYLLLTTCRLLLATYYLLLTIYYLLLTTYYLLLTTHYALLTTYYLLLTTY